MEEEKKMSVSEQGEILIFFSKALQREVHNLTPHPGLLWQQMYNTLRPLKHSLVNSLLDNAAEKRNNQQWLETVEAVKE